MDKFLHIILIFIFSLIVDPTPLHRFFKAEPQSGQVLDEQYTYL